MSVFDKIININVKSDMGIVGITDEFFCVYLNNLLVQKRKNILVVVNSIYEANKIYSSLKSYTDRAFLFPMDDFLTSEALASSPELKLERLETINNIISNDPLIIITNLMGYLRFLPSKNVYEKFILKLKLGMKFDPKE